ncbi:MAG TPA: class I SAM-dependent methyltransferase [Candidatus Binatia bacterium]|jgi:SAM-dependent methyltransferase
MNESKQAVLDFWNTESCGESLYLDGYSRDDYLRQSNIRYHLEPYILEFAGFDQVKKKKVLEIGTGLGADHQKFSEAGAILYGIDLTRRAVEHSQRRFRVFGLNTNLQVADAEDLAFENECFDFVYSWGVLHHTPNTERAVAEASRVLKPGGTAKIMIYHKYSFVGFMLWIRYALVRLKPMMPLNQIYSQYLESPGTKAYSISEARELFRAFTTVDAEVVLTHGDLLSSAVGQRHRGLFLTLARLIWPRWLIRTFFKKYGLFMLITATK